MSYKIIGDSCTDYSQGEMDWLTRVPLSLHIQERTYLDDSDLDVSGFVQDMGSSPVAPRSACPGLEAYLNAFAGPEEEIYVVTLSSELSGSYNSAVQAAKLYLEDKEDKRIHIFNSKSASAGQVSICLYIRELAERGLPFDEVVGRGEKYITDMSTLFALEDLEVFRKNGRLGPLQAVITGKLKIKLVMAATDEGSIYRRSQAISMQQALNKMVNIVVEQARKTNNSIQRLVISHCLAASRAESVERAVKAKCDVKQSIICCTSGISSMYAGPGGVVVCF